MIKIAYDQNIVEAESLLSDLFDITPFDGRSLTPHFLEPFEALLVRSVTPVNRQLLSSSQLSFVGTATAGIDHIDTGYLKESNCTFASAAGSNATSVGEYVLSALKECNLLNKPNLKVGIVGYGHVGKEVARLIKALGITALPYDPPLVDSGISTDLVSLETLYEADVLSFHTPLTTSNQSQYPTSGIVNRSFLSNFKTGLTFINSARGGIVVEEEIIALAKEGFFKDIILDVFNHEPTPSQDYLKCASVYTPHIAGYSYTGKVRGTLMMRDALLKHFNLNRPKTTTPVSSNTICIKELTDTEALEKVLSSVYSIQDDFEHSKPIIQKSDGILFDTLRKEYPRRLEYSDYCIENILSSKLKEQLKKLGFLLKT
ncbi:MAG: 4-phosphoerythronate dehydrogenase [Fibrobacterales bacterium]